MVSTLCSSATSSLPDRCRYRYNGLWVPVPGSPATPCYASVLVIKCDDSYDSSYKETPGSSKNGTSGHCNETKSFFCASPTLFFSSLDLNPGHWAQSRVRLASTQITASQQPQRFCKVQAAGDPIHHPSNDLPERIDRGTVWEQGCLVYQCEWEQGQADSAFQPASSFAAKALDGLCLASHQNFAAKKTHSLTHITLCPHQY